LSGGEQDVKAAAIVHEVLLDLDEPFPSELPVGSDMVVRVKATCASGCDIAGRLVMLMHGEETLASSIQGEFAASIPKQPGAYWWTLMFPRQEIAGVLHDRASMQVSFVATPVATSLAVWDVPSPSGGRAPVKWARKRHVLSPTGAIVSVDGNGEVIGRGQLGATPWEGTTGLYWTELEFTAPSAEGLVRLTARFGGGETELPHGESTAQFSVAVVKRPEHRLTIRIVEQDTSKPIENASVRLGPFRSLTNADGVAEVLIPKGTFEVTVWHAAYETSPMTVEVTRDATLELTGVAVPQEDPSARFMM
jgi:hypothetical protein